MKKEPNQERHPLWIFTPSRTNPKDLESIFVQRQELLKDAVERVRESALTANKHYMLFVGPRGCGKTHFVTLLVSRLGQDAALKNHLRIAWLNEDETCTTLLELLLKIHAALEKRYPKEFLAADVAPVYDKNAREALVFVQQHLLRSLGTRSLLVVAENLDVIFEGLGDAGQKDLRAFIQEHPQFCLAATAQRLVDELAKRDTPFFGFFQTEHFKPLKVEQATQLLQKIATLQGEVDMVEFLSTSRGRSRVRALHHLSGGNHRVYIVLSQFITRDSIDALVAPFMKMVDELTPYYQERLRWLPILQRKIVEYLCICERTVPVKDIAKRLFTTPQTTSSQLQGLRERGYVESEQNGREFLYELSEPLMRICVEVKDSQTPQPLKLLVDFLRVWYEDEDLKKRLGTEQPDSIACKYLEAAIERNSVDGNLRNRILVGGVEKALSDTMPSSMRSRLIQSLRKLPDAAVLACESWLQGQTLEAFEYLRQGLAETITSEDKAGILYVSSELHRISNHLDKTIKDCKMALDLPGVSVKMKALLWISQGSSLIQAGNTQAAIKAFGEAIVLPTVPSEDVMTALLKRGEAYSSINKIEKALTDYTDVITLNKASSEHLTFALIKRGNLHHFHGDLAKAQADYEAALEVDAAPTVQIVVASQLLTIIRWQNGQWNEGFKALAYGLEKGSADVIPFYGQPESILIILFVAGLDDSGRKNNAYEILRLFEKHRALPTLGEGLVQHLGHILRKGAPFPSTDNLESWAQAWDKAGANIPEFRLPLRLLRTGIDFLKTGGKHQGILLSLITPERRILKQALGLEKEDED